MLDHLRSRNMEPSLYNLKLTNDSAVFLLYNFSGQLVGYHNYRPNGDKSAPNDPWEGKYFTRVREGFDAVWGLEQLNDDPTIFIVEGLFKAAAFHKVGRNALAVFANNPKRLKPWFKILSQTRNLIAIADDDSAGKKLLNLVGCGLQHQDVDELDSNELMTLSSSWSRTLPSQGRNAGSNPVRVTKE